MPSQREFSSFDHHAFIMSPHLWPHWPYLPVKRFIRNGLKTELQCGIVHATDRATVIEVNLFSSPEKRQRANRHKYANVDELLADGWVVD